MLDSILINPPVSSPLHPQANLPLLKTHLESNGFSTRVIDSNIMFFHHFLGQGRFNLTMDELYDNPLKILAAYDSIEKQLSEKSSAYENFSIGMRFLSMKYDHSDFNAVVKSLTDKKANPFINFYNQVITRYFINSGIRIPFWCYFTIRKS